MNVESYYGTVCIGDNNPEEIFSIFPRRDLTTREWIWWEKCFKVTRYSRYYPTEHFYFKPYNYLLLKLKS